MGYSMYVSILFRNGPVPRTGKGHFSILAGSFFHDVRLTAERYATNRQTISILPLLSAPYLFALAITQGRKISGCEMILLKTTLVLIILKF